MGTIKDLWRHWAQKFEPTRQQGELWRATDDEIESLKARVKRLEDGTSDDGK